MTYNKIPVLALAEKYALKLLDQPGKIWPFNLPLLGFSTLDSRGNTSLLICTDQGLSIPPWQNLQNQQGIS